MRDGTARERSGQFRRRHVAFALVQQLDVTAQGDGSQTVFGSVRIPTHAREQRFAEADAEAQDLEAEFLRDPIVPEFMHRHQDADGNQERSQKNHNLHAEAPALSLIRVIARRLAAASASKTSPSVLTGDELSRCSTLSMTVEMPTKF